MLILCSGLYVPLGVSRSWGVRLGEALGGRWDIRLLLLCVVLGEGVGMSMLHHAVQVVGMGGWARIVQLVG